FLRSLGVLYTSGFPVLWPQLTPAGRCVPLPHYPWQRKRYWAQSKQSSGQPVLRSGYGGSSFLGTRLLSPLPHIQYETQLHPGTRPLLHDHRLSSREVSEPAIIASGSTYLVLALAAARDALHTSQCQLDDIHFPESLELSEQEATTVHCVLGH